MKKLSLLVILMFAFLIEGKGFALVYDCSLQSYDDNGNSNQYSSFTWDSDADEFKVEEFGFDDLIGACYKRDGVAGCIIAHRDNLHGSKQRSPFVISQSLDDSKLLGVSVLRKKINLMVFCYSGHQAQKFPAERFKF